MSEMLPNPAGTCQYCHCTAENPCRLYSNDECGWTTSARDVCSKISCVLKERAAKRETERKRRRDLAAVVTPIARRVMLARRKEDEERRKRAKRMAKQSRRAA